MKDDIKEILDNPKILMLSYGNYISLDDSFKLKEHIIDLQEKYERLRTELNAKNNIINELEKYTKENIKVIENRLNTPFCNFEKATKELSIFKNYLDKLKELKEINNG